MVRRGITGVIRDIVRGGSKSTITVKDVERVQERAKADREMREKIGDPGGFLTPPTSTPGTSSGPGASSGGGGDGGAAARAAEAARLAEQQRLEARRIEQERIERERLAAVAEARKEKLLRDASARNEAERRSSLNKFLEDTEAARRLAQEERIRTGVSESATRRTITSQTSSRTDVITKESLERERLATQTLQQQQSQIALEEQSRQQQDIKERDIALRDVSFVRTFFPDVAQKKGIEGELFQTFVEQKFQDLTRKVESKIEPFFPEGKTKDFLFKPRDTNIRVTDLAKFAFFSPLLATTPETISKLVETGQITPTTDTTFQAVIKSKETLQQIDVSTKTQIGGTEGVTKVGFSRQLSNSLDDTTSLTAGRGVVGSGQEFTTFDVVGFGKVTGKAGGTKVFTSNVDDASVILTRDFGKGIEITSVSKNTFLTTEQASLTLGSKGITLLNEIKVNPLLTANTKINFPSGKITTTNLFDTSKLGGVIRETSDDTLFQFAGTTDKLTTKISSEGISKGFSSSDINVRGVIRLLGDTSKDSSGITFISGSGTQTSLSKTFAPTLTEQTTKNVLTQVSGASTQASKQVISDLAIPSTVNIVKDLSRSATTILEEPTKEVSKLDIIPTGKIEDLGIAGSRLNLASLTLQQQPQRSRTRQQQKTKQKQEQETGTILRTGQLQDLQLRQQQKQGLLLRTQTRQTQRTPTRFFIPLIVTPRTKVPTTPPPKLPVLPKLITPKIRRGNFLVEVRRRGRFSPIGTTKTLRGALALGTGRVTSTLAATTRIKGLTSSAGLKIPTGFRLKSGKDGLLIIEKRKKRLSTKTERKEIQRAKKRKRKKS